MTLSAAAQGQPNVPQTPSYRPDSEWATKDVEEAQNVRLSTLEGRVARIEGYMVIPG